MLLKQIFARGTKLRAGQICNAISIVFSTVYFLQTRLFTEQFSRTSTIHLGIFRGPAKWADCVSPRINTIAPRDYFKPIFSGEL